MEFLFNKKPTLAPAHTGETCERAGTYKARHCTPNFYRQFQPGDDFTKCKHGQHTTWTLAPSWPPSKANIGTFVALAMLSVGAVFLVWPQELGPETLRSAYVPILFEARRQSHGILLLLASQALIISIVTTRQSNGTLAAWAIICAAVLPFAAELNKLDQNNATQNLVVICSCAPIFIKIMSHAPTGRSLGQSLVWIMAYGVVGIAAVAVVINTRLGPIFAIIFGWEVTNLVLAIIILLAAIAIIVGWLGLLPYAHGRMMRSSVN